MTCELLALVSSSMRISRNVICHILISDELIDGHARISSGSGQQYDCPTLLELRGCPHRLRVCEHWELQLHGTAGWARSWSRRWSRMQVPMQPTVPRCRCRTAAPLNLLLLLAWATSYIVCLVSAAEGMLEVHGIIAKQ